MNLALKIFDETCKAYASVLDPDTLASIKEKVSDAEIKFQTDLYVNVTHGLIEKAASLKTEKAKQKYRLQVINLLQEGLNNPNSNREQLNALLTDINTSV